MAHLLVVDDDPDIRLLLRYELAPEGHQVSEAGDGEACLAALRTDPPDLVLLDLMMPVLDGWEVLRSLQGVDAPPIIVITAFRSEGDRHVAELLGLGALDVVAKPFDPGWLVRLTDAVLKVAPDEREEYRRRRRAQAQGS